MINEKKKVTLYDPLAPFIVTNTENCKYVTILVRNRDMDGYNVIAYLNKTDCNKFINALIDRRDYTWKE